MNTSKNPLFLFLGAVLGLGLLAILGWGAFIAMRFLWAAFQSLDGMTSNLFVLGGAIAVFCALWLSRTLQASMARLAKSVQSEKRAAYSEFASLWFTLAASGKRLDEWPEDWIRLEPRLALWAGDRVLKRFHQLQRHAREASPSDPESVKSAERVISEMRKELGCA
jgi:hypothetical protein